MEPSIQKRLRQAKRSIERRWDGPRVDRGKPMFAASSIRVELADKIRGISAGGGRGDEGDIRSLMRAADDARLFEYTPTVCRQSHRSHMHLPIPKNPTQIIHQCSLV